MHVLNKVKPESTKFPVLQHCCNFLDAKVLMQLVPLDFKSYSQDSESPLSGSLHLGILLYLFEMTLETYLMERLGDGRVVLKDLPHM